MRKPTTKPKKRRQRAACDARALLGGIDTLYLSCKPHVSESVRAKLQEAKAAAQALAASGGVHCPDWLGSRVLPNGAKGYSFLIETEDFTVKVALEHMTQWPGVYLELRSHFLHTHPEGARGACEEALCWVRSQLFYDQDEATVQRAVTFDAAVLSRVDVHIDWQGGFTPRFAEGEVRRFIKPRRLHWHPYFEGTSCTGYRFGEGDILARVYNKTVQCQSRHDDSYTALLEARNEEVQRALLLALVAGLAGYATLAFASAAYGRLYDPSQPVWRLEFQLRREGMTGYKLLAPEADTDDAEALEAEAEADVSAEDLPHIGTLPKLFAHLDALFQHLSYHWLRLVVPAKTKVRSRWPLDPTWVELRRAFPRLVGRTPLDARGYELVRGARYSGRARLLRKMALGVAGSLEVEDASVVSASLAALTQYAQQVAQKEQDRLIKRYVKAKLPDGTVPEDVQHGWRVANERAEQVQHRLQMLLGIFAAYGVLPLDYAPSESVEHLLLQHVDALEAEAETKGGVRALLDAHFSKVYKVPAHAGV